AGIVAAPLQVCTGAEAAAFACHEKAANAIFRVFYSVHRLHQPAQHLRRNGVHDFRMIERQCANTAVYIEFHSLEFHVSFSLCTLRSNAFFAQAVNSGSFLVRKPFTPAVKFGWSPSMPCVSRS